MLPTIKVAVSATFSCAVVCSFHMIGRGNTSMTTSVTMLGKVLQINNASLFRHWSACTAGDAQLAEKGRQAARSIVKLTMDVLIRITTVMQSMMNTTRCGNRRLYITQMATLEMLIVT